MIASLALLSFTGCAGPEDELGAARAALEYENALTPNALTPNALTPNALTPNASSALRDPGAAGELSRQLLRYVVSCAFDSTQSFSFSWDDASGAENHETYWGQLGLATTWSAEPLDLPGQEWVSACLASRTNWYGVPVLISSRGAHPALDKEGLPEMTTYLFEEGAFWGNLFGPSPALYACYNTLDRGHSRASLRDCAAGHVTGSGSVAACGIIQIVGACDLRCSVLSPLGLYHPSCARSVLDPSTATGRAITVFLP